MQTTTVTTQTCTYTVTRGLSPSRRIRPTQVRPGTFRRPVVIHRRQMSLCRHAGPRSGLGMAWLRPAVLKNFRLIALTAEARQDRAYTRLQGFELTNANDVPVDVSGPMLDEFGNPYLSLLIGLCHPDGPDFSGRYLTASTVKVAAAEQGFVATARLRGTGTPPFICVTLYSPDCPVSFYHP